MGDAVIIILVLLVITQIVFSIWNYFSLNYLKKKTFYANEQLNDAKYYELKSKHEFVIATISIVTTALVFLGYNSIQGMQDKLKADYDKKVESATAKLTSAEIKVNDLSNGIDGKFQQVDTSFKRYSNYLLKLEMSQAIINDQAEKTKNNLNNAQARINEINSKNIFKQNLYIVENLQFDIKVIDDSTESNDWKRFYFKDLRTISGDRLPEFRKPPFIVSALSNVGSTAAIQHITKEYFDLATFQYFTTENSPSLGKSDVQYFTIMISEIP